MIRTPHDEVFPFGGSFRCSYHPLVREDWPHSGPPGPTDHPSNKNDTEETERK